MFKSSVYPALEELEQPLSSQQLQILKNQLESEKPESSSQSQFNYAWGLIKSNSHRQVQEGIDLLVQIYKHDSSMRRECLYYLSLGSYKVGDYGNSRRYVDKLLEVEPDNQQAKGLKESIEDKVTTDGLIGLGIGAGVLAVGVGIIAGVFGRKRR